MYYVFLEDICSHQFKFHNITVFNTNLYNEKHHLSVCICKSDYSDTGINFLYQSRVWASLVDWQYDAISIWTTAS